MAYFPEVSKIVYEGPDSKNPLAFRHYNADEVVEGKTMREHFRFAAAYWHTMRGMGGDPFGPGCAIRPWEDGSDSVAMALTRVKVFFEFMEKLGTPYYCFHDRDVAPEGSTLAESNANLDQVVKALKGEQERTGIKLLWGTANLFSNKRFVHGAATSPNADVFAYSAAQVKKAMEVTLELGGENYVFWGGREGYMSLYNTDLKREVDHLAKFFHLAVDYKKKIGFTGTFLIEPKPKEPTTHQYDFDSANSIAFLKSNGLGNEFKLNIETNHATLAGHTMMHELAYCAMHGMLGSIDANRGDLLLGWDTDQFPTDLYLTAQTMLVVLAQGGIGAGGFNFDAKVRRESFDPIDLFHAHVGAMDAFAQGLKIAAAIRKDGLLTDMIKQRYASWDTGIGAQIEAGQVGFAELEQYMLAKGEITPNSSGRLEMIENIINRYIR
ncbi:xylose isomerase [Tuwongella immobilis]|uniref:Xylose isomerase n=1 Tax=Tuwongella immobilis TaxID=692036 RepID=A0A6C2YR89_9BACT|nr:xylose isomerase [Tuwongella immobilis]VIP04168.1 xylose isomerase : Xylose isomerase OS=Blastopirellula marina DSM 3645 GN=xylA PE=3 SV=1: AP_endonuc_2 [Tuwongella immobilis]VTS05701.1 xylose isomerase : Xylose isomerase OS=Blastopirellula marina DSM 3645 GN=xylA PE=3 SV=1: AP_endonuc_2 [Tuwongella immobilis]